MHESSPRYGKRPSDATIISDDETPTPITKTSKSRRSLTGYPSTYAQSRIPLPLSRVSLESLQPSSTNHLASTRSGWRGWNESTCFGNQQSPDESDHVHDGNGDIPKISDCLDNNCRRIQPRPAETADGEQGYELRRLTYWRRKGGKFWTHEMYRGLNGEEIKIHYCKTRAESERVARLLVNEPILGFDMEWKPRGSRGIKNNISLIQLACEDEIALFHLALHEGRTVESLLAPTLRKILESPDIIKTGVAILHADGRRLQRFMRLEPRGLFELSHLHRLVKYYGNWPEKVNKTLVSLAKQVQEHLGKPLFKGRVRTSDWTKPLNAEQIRYSAADAYAGFRLFHAMEMKRLSMVPVPPRPAFAELDLPIKVSCDTDRPNADHIPVQVPSAAPSRGYESIATTDQELQDPRSAAPSPASESALENDPIARRALSALCGLRIRLSRAMSVDPHLVASEATLLKLAVSRPRDGANLESLLCDEAFLPFARQQGIDLIDFLNKFAPE
ncbi:MAG: hypothetical protein Q9165_008675 [Trypethelium subeluteriae]